MKVISKMDLEDFEFWGGAIENAKHFTPYELECIQDTIEELYPDGIDETTINDLFWFESDTTLKEWLDDYATEEDLAHLFSS